MASTNRDHDEPGGRNGRAGLDHIFGTKALGMARTLIAIAVAGALGALSRYGLGSFVSRRTSDTFPWGTFVVNVTGAFILVLTLATERWDFAPWLRLGLTTGFLGAYTTFSTLSFETYKLAADRALGLAAANMLGSCAAGLAAIYLGVVLARTV
jgi:CrcB protein